MALFRQSGITMPEGMQMVIFGVLIFPAFDLLRVIRERVREQRGILTPDRNQIQHRLQRTGMNRTMVPVAILFIILSFATFNSWWVIYGYKHLAILFIIDIALFAGLQTIITFAI
jgi:hypothetical protein